MIAYGVITIRKGDDLLNWAQAKKKNIWLERRLISATFKMEFEGTQKRIGDHGPSSQRRNLQSWKSIRDHRSLAYSARLYYLEASTKEDAS